MKNNIIIKYLYNIAYIIFLLACGFYLGAKVTIHFSFTDKILLLIYVFSLVILAFGYLTKDYKNK